MARALSCEDENLVDYFIIATKRFDGSAAQLSFVYPPLDDDHDETDFCENVTMFAFPHGYVRSWDGRSLPPPPAHNLFTLTDPQGDHLYGASISFFETASHVKSLCVLTRRPFYTQMLRYLEQLLLLGLHHARSGDNGGDAVERALCNLFHEVPVPYRGLSVQMQVGELEIMLERPPFLDFPFEGDAELMLYAFMVMEPKVLQQLYHHVLLEHRVLIVGNDSVLVTAVVETLKTLIFPLTWLHVVIPNIPDSLDLSTLLDAPVPFLAGAHTAQLQHVDIPSNVVKYDLSESRLVVPSAANNNNQYQYQQNLDSVVLPPLPEASTRLLQKLSTTRLTDLHTQKKELHQKLWDRRIQLQKCCLATTSISSSASSGRAPVITPKQFFLVKQSLVYRKMMKLYLEVIASMLQDFPHDKFVDKKPVNARPFYRALAETAQFQSFVAQHAEYTAGVLPLEDAAKFQFVHKTLLSAERVITGNQADASRAVAMALTKTFVALTPQDSSREANPASDSAEPDMKARVETVVFPAVKLEAFGEPRPILFPSMATDAVHASLGTFISPSSGVASRRASKDTTDWMQSFMRTVPLPSALASSSASLSRSNNSSSGSHYHERSLRSIFGSPTHTAAASPPLTMGLSPQAPFKRSRTIDRLKKAAPFYRTMTQKALDSTLSSLASAAASMATSAVAVSTSAPQLSTRPTTVVRSIWLITTSSCACSDRIVVLTHALVEQLQLDGSKSSPHVAHAYCALIHALAVCGHPSEAKAVFEECLSGSALLSLAPIAAMPHFWKPFSALLQCYVMNGLVQRAFDLLVQVQLEKEQLLNPSLGVLQFTAQVLSADSEAMVERVYVTFSCGNLGLRLAPRGTPAHAGSSGIGCELIAFDHETSESEEDSSSPTETVEQASRLHVHDLVETINGELVLHHAFDEIITSLKQASRPMTVTFVRGLDRLSMLTLHSAGADDPRRSSSSFSVSSASSTSAVVDGKSSSTCSSSKCSPRRDLCDRFGLLPQRGIRLTTLADCDCCGTRLSLAQVQRGWSSTDAKDYTTECSSCHHRFVPRLCVMLGVMTTMYQPAHRSSGLGASATRMQLPADATVEQFVYLSMPVIRRELSNLAAKEPLALVSMRDLRETNPRIYWNIVVKLLSLEVPLDFMELPDATSKLEQVTPTKTETEQAPAVGKATTTSAVDADAQDMRVLCELVRKRAERIQSESTSSQRIDDVLVSVLLALEQQTKEALHGKSDKATTTNAVPGRKRWSLLGSLTTSSSLNLRAATPTTNTTTTTTTTTTSAPAPPAKLTRGCSNSDDEMSGYDERETDVEDMRSCCTVSVTDSAVLDECCSHPADGTTTKPSRGSKFTMPSLPSAPFQRSARGFPSK